MSFVTYKGNEFNYEKPTTQSINIDDIVLSLSRINRFVGHSSRAYSVAEHSVNCFLMAEKLNYTNREKLLVLIHDFTEAYVGDCPSPLKKLLPEFSIIESRVEYAICQKYNISPPTFEEESKIKSIDLTMLAIEMRDLTKHNWTKFIYDCTHLEMLEDEDFEIEESHYGEAQYQNILKTLFNDLLEDCKKEGIL